MMPRLALSLSFLLLSTLSAAPPRFARAGECEGAAELQLHPAEPWQSVVRNTPLPQGSRLRTDSGTRFEIEIDDGAVLRLVGDALAEISDAARLSTGQRISLYSLDHGTFYFTGRPPARDSLSVAVPGAQVTLRQRARVRFEISTIATEIAVLEGVVRFSTPTAELDLREGQLARVQPGRAGRFQLFREIPTLDSDGWSEKRDAAREISASARHLPNIPFGTVDLDLSGSWLQTDESGLVWKPKPAEGWAPFQNGTWHWFDEVGYTWIAAEPWGWLPYHFGRWLQNSSLGWVWVPSYNNAFKPGEVFWMQAPGLALWGPLSPGEAWTGRGPAQQFAGLNTAAARFEPGQRDLDPAVAVVRPKDLLASARFTAALPSPPLPGQRRDAVNSALQSTGVGAITLASPDVTVPGSSFEPRPLAAAPATVAPPPPRPVTTTVIVDRPVYVEVPEPVEIFYPVPVYSGVIVLNPVVAKQPTPDRPNNTPEPPHHIKKRIAPPEATNPAGPDARPEKTGGY